MKDLIKALNIFLKYSSSDQSPMTHCEHDVLMVGCIKRDLDPEDVKRLNKLSFYWSEEEDCWESSRFGSC